MSDVSESDCHLECYYKDLKDGYTLYCDVDYFDSDRIRLVTISITKDDEEVGSCESYLIDRDGFDDFYDDCNEVDESLTVLSTTLFHERGRLRKDMWPMFSEKEIHYSSSGGYLYIYMLKIEKEHRGNDLGFECLAFLMNCLKGQWTLSVVELTYLSKSHRDHKKLQIYQLFSRFGYMSNQVKYLDYWFLIPKKLKQITKSSSRNFRHPLLERLKPYPLNSMLDRLILSASLEQRFCKKKDGRLQKLLRACISQGMKIDSSKILIVAASRGLSNLVQVLIEENANINIKNEQKETPLHAACRSGSEECIELLMKSPGCKLYEKDRYDETPFDVFLFYLRSSFILDSTIDASNISDSADCLSKYTLCMNLMPVETRKILIEKVISPRMFKRLNNTTTFYSDMAIDDMEFTDFKNNHKIPPSQLLDISLMECIPLDVIKDGVYSGFVQGFVDILAVTSVIMNHGEQLPTVNRILKLCQSKCHPSFKYFLDNGGRVRHILKGIIDCVAASSWECGDNSEAEDEDETLPEVKGLDGNFDFLKTFVLDYLVQN